MALSNFYTTGVIDSYVLNSSTVKFPCKMTRKLNELFANGIDTLDSSCFIAGNTNNKQLLTMTKVNANGNDNYDSSLFIQNPVQKVMLKEDFEYANESAFIGTVLLALDNSTTVPRGIYSAKHNKTTHTGYNDDTLHDARIITDINGTGLNDIYVNYTLIDLFDTHNFDENTFIKSTSWVVFYCPDLKNRTSKTDVETNRYQLNGLVPCFVLTTEDDILFIPYYYYFLRGQHYCGYSHNNNKYTFDWTATGSGTPTLGYFNDTQKYAFLPFRLSGDTTTNILLGDDDHGSTAIFHETNGYESKYRGLKYNHALWLFNTIGLKWITNIDTNVYTDIKLPFMDTNGIVDKTKFDKGLSAIRTSKSANADLSYDKIPTFTPPTPINDEIDKMTIDTSELSGATIAGAVTYYTMTNVQLTEFMDSLAESTAEHPNIDTGFVTASYIPNVLDSVVHATDMPIKIKGVTLTARGNKVILQHSILLASFSVPRRHNNAFDTMTKYFIYTPYTDVIPLNYKCFGRTLSVYLLPSLQDCMASIVIQCDGMTIAKQTVSLGSSLAISLENSAEKTTAIVNACSKYLASAGGVVGGAVTGNIPAIAGGTIGVVASTVNVLNALGNTYIHSYGATTGTTLSLNPKNIYVIEYVVQTDKPSNFARVSGNLVNTEMTISAGMGFTKIGNPRISTNLTAPEYAELINLLENGVIL